MDIEDNLKLQLDEVEMLESMFPDPKELVIDQGRLADVKQWILHPSDTIPFPLEVTLNLDLDQERKICIECVISLPHSYPSDCQPEVYLRSGQLQRQQQTKFNEELQQFLKSEVLPQVYNIVSPATIAYKSLF